MSAWELRTCEFFKLSYSDDIMCEWKNSREVQDEFAAHLPFSRLAESFEQKWFRGKFLIPSKVGFKWVIWSCRTRVSIQDKLSSKQCYSCPWHANENTIGN